MSGHLVERGPHLCDLPGWSNPGDIWQCDLCNRTWKFVHPGNPDYAGWRREGPISRFLRGHRQAARATPDGAVMAREDP